jgi:hypothetical protein
VSTSGSLVDAHPHQEETMARQRHAQAALGAALMLTALAWVLLMPAPAVSAQPGSAAARPGHGERSSSEDALLRRARQATRRFRDVAAAEAAGYAPVGECADDPKYGGMGIHYGNPELIADGVLDVTRPEVLVYQPTRRGRLRLGALEYFLVDEDQDLASDGDRPSLFGMPFDGPMLGHDAEMPIHYDLHVWLYRHNRAGTFAAFNPRVRCP